jgi:hypothetical protein
MLRGLVPAALPPAAAGQPLPVARTATVDADCASAR